MMHHNSVIVRCVLGLGAALIGSQMVGCVSYHVAYNPSYLPADRPSAQVDGKGMIYTDPSDESYVFKGRPSSLSGHGSTLVMPLGVINREVAAATLGGVFRGGCYVSGDRQVGPGCVAVVQPRVVSYDYEYDSLRNLGFKMTPQVKVAMQVNVYDMEGTLYFTKTYDSGTVNGTTVWGTLKPAELINRATHQALAGLYAQAAADIAAQIRAHGTTAAPARVPAAAKPADAPVGQNSADRLKELKRLRDEGLISDDVYKKKQQEIIDSI